MITDRLGAQPLVTQVLDELLFNHCILIPQISIGEGRAFDSVVDLITLQHIQWQDELGNKMTAKAIGICSMRLK